jgi:hypothetical protein
MTEGPSPERLATRLRRLDQQIRAFKDLHVAELQQLAQKQEAIAKLHADELELILEQVSDIVAEIEAPKLPAAPAGPSDDPASGSPKRAAWLAEQRRAAEPVSRRDLLLGHRDEA